MKRRKLIFISAYFMVLCLLTGMTGTVNASETGNVSAYLTGLMRPVEMDKLKLLSSDEEQKLYDSMNSYVPAEDTLLKNDAVSFYYYEQLEPKEQEMYDIMLMIANDPVEDNIGVMMTDADPSSDEFYASFVRAYYAMTYDHPEVFWLYYSTEDYFYYSSNAIVNNGIYIVYFRLNEDYADYESKMTAFNEAAADFLSTIDTDTSQYEIARQIHDKLINTVSYNHPVSDNGGKDLAHTAFGALVRDSSGNAHKPVCDGYTLAYEYLLQQCGIEAAYIGGVAGSDKLSAGGHAWNIVKLDGQWYEVDATWDDSWNDMRDEGDPYINILLDDYSFHSRLEHYLFLLSTPHMTDYDVDSSYFTYYFSDGSYYWFSPQSVHIRDSASDAFLTETEKAVYSLMDQAPIADYDYILTW